MGSRNKNKPITTPLKRRLAFRNIHHHQTRTNNHIPNLERHPAQNSLLRNLHHRFVTIPRSTSRHRPAPDNLHHNRHEIRTDKDLGVQQRVHHGPLGAVPYDEVLERYRDGRGDERGRKEEGEDLERDGVHGPWVLCEFGAGEVAEALEEGADAEPEGVGPGAGFDSVVERRRRRRAKVMKKKVEAGLERGVP
ncbi:hypothetical protein CSAL01_11966 [Colletotrichum salicis]|uniref:Uncharacterized protein n=1 Tax=Colletotrichum salicis TaxID=1209931 RepID=A0A135V279_9PEZI|nr:hypothetical protein CSAL01_11966 [Colletotrichum salicis]